MNRSLRKNYKIGFVSLGCAKNLCDTEVMLHHLMEAGYGITPEETEADVVVINTCAFIESAKKESIDSILDIAWLKEHRNLRGIVVTGCLAERYREQVTEELPEVDALLGVGAIHKITEAVDSILDKAEKKFVCVEGKETVTLGGDRVVTTGDAWAYLKIAEGCNNRCTYCAIPMIRGKLRSRPMDDIIKEAKDLEKSGIKELVLIAQDTSVYGLDLYGEYKLPQLLHRLSLETKIPWLRILYCYPDKITDELVEEMKTNPRVLHYIDLPIQHISDSVLKRMNRHGDSACIKDAVRRLRSAMPDVVVRTTAIVGFPGETDEDFSELCSFVKETKFERFGAFTYSKEENTPAADLPDQIDEQVKQDRYDILMKTQQDISEKLNENLVGKTLRVLCEGFDQVSEAFFGRSYRDAPESDGKVWFSAEKSVKEGEFVDVEITEAMDYDLVGVAKV